MKFIYLIIIKSNQFSGISLDNNSSLKRIRSGPSLFMERALTEYFTERKVNIMFKGKPAVLAFRGAG